jgi:hypothetical protein
MKNESVSLTNIQGKLSRAEMKNIIAGRETYDCKTDWDPCSTANGDICCPGLVCANSYCQKETAMNE